MGDNDLMSALQMIGQIPATAAAAKTGLQAGLQSAEKQATNFAYAHLALSAATVVIGFATFLVLIRRCQIEERKKSYNGGRRR